MPAGHAGTSWGSHHSSGMGLPMQPDAVNTSGGISAGSLKPSWRFVGSARKYPATTWSARSTSRRRGPRGRGRGGVEVGAAPAGVEARVEAHGGPGEEEAEEDVDDVVVAQVHRREDQQHDGDEQRPEGEAAALAPRDEE